MREFSKNITSEEIRSLSPATFGGEVEIVDNDDSMKKACDYLAKCSLLGFDTETKPAFKVGVMNKVALLQLTDGKRCFLFRLCRMQLDRLIIKILENKDIIKVGVDVKGDIRDLNKLRRFDPRGFVELQNEVAQFGIEDKSLRKIAAIVTGKAVSKAQRLSNWEGRELTPAQQRYATVDATICLEIYHILTQ